MNDVMFPHARVLVIDDEPQIRRVVRNALAGVVGQVLEAANAHEGVDMAAAEQPHLVVLDLGLADRDGFDVCSDLRSFTAAPIIVLTARHSVAEKERLFEAGADDYVTKPFSTVELRARMRAQLRRVHAAPGAAQPSRISTTDGLEIDLGARRVKRDGADIHLTPTEWNLLRAFITHRGRTLTHAQLFSSVWRPDTSGDTQQYLRVYVGQLRRKLETDPLRPLLIRTEPGVGYRFDTGE